MRKIITKLLHVCILGLYKLWLTKSKIIHITSNDEASMEELIKVREEFTGLIDNTLPFLECMKRNRVTIPEELSSILTSTLKRWLFEYYSTIGDNSQYDRVNHRLIIAKRQLNQTALLSDIEIRNRAYAVKKSFIESNNSEYQKWSLGISLLLTSRYYLI